MVYKNKFIKYAKFSLICMSVKENLLILLLTKFSKRSLVVLFAIDADTLTFNL